MEIIMGYLNNFPVITHFTPETTLDINSHLPTSHICTWTKFTKYTRTLFYSQLGPKVSEEQPKGKWKDK